MTLALDRFTYGIDISGHNRINWDEIPDWITTVGIKATEGIGWTDPMFVEHIENALEHGKIVHPYHYYRTKVGGRISDPRGQAEWFLEVARPYDSDTYMRSLDVERGPYDVERYGGYYNPPVSTIANDLRTYQYTLLNDSWEAFDTIYTNPGTWNYWGLQNPSLLEKLKTWLSEDLADGLWLATYLTGLYPTKESDLPFEVDPTKYYAYPYPFTEHFQWQVTSKFVLAGSYASNWLPKLIDFNIIPHSKEVVKSMLGIDSPQNPPDEGGTPDLTELLAEVKQIREHVQMLTAHFVPAVEDPPEPPEPEPEPEPEPPEPGWEGWQNRPMEDWPAEVGNLRVAYVKPTQAKLPLWVPNKDDVLIPYQNENLRSWSNPANTDSVRINTYADDYIMVYRDGPNEYHTPHPDVHNYVFDGANQAYLVMEEQTLDGINLRNDTITVPLYISAQKTSVVYIP